MVPTSLNAELAVYIRQNMLVVAEGGLAQEHIAAEIWCVCFKKNWATAEPYLLRERYICICVGRGEF